MTHDQEEALSLGGHVAVMGEGRFVPVGPLGHLPLATRLGPGNDVMVLVSPEQCVRTAGNGPEAADASVTADDYHGHDANTDVVLDAHPDRSIVGRVKATEVVAPGRRVALTVTGTVHAWPADKGSVSDPEPTVAMTGAGWAVPTGRKVV